MLIKSVHFERTNLNSAASASSSRSAYRPNKGYRWVLQDNSIQLLPAISRQSSFKWSYVLARTLKRLNPANYL